MITEPTILPEDTTGLVPLARFLALWEVTAFHRDPDPGPDLLKPNGWKRTFYVAHKTKWKAQRMVQQHLRDQGVWVNLPKARRVPTHIGSVA